MDWSWARLAASRSEPTDDGETVMDGAPGKDEMPGVPDRSARFGMTVSGRRGSVRAVVLDEVLQGVADAEVGGDDVAGLHPAEDPGDGAEVFHAALCAGAGVGALGGAGADVGVSSSATGVACSK